MLDRFEGTHRLIGELLYGTGMRIMEGVRLRVKDVEFARGEIVVRDGKGAKDRARIWSKSARCMRGILPMGSVPFIFQARCSASIRVRRAIGDGSTFFPRAALRRIHAAAR